MSERIWEVNLQRAQRNNVSTQWFLNRLQNQSPLTHRNFKIQRQWQYNMTACYRPPPESTIPIVCTIEPGYQNSTYYPEPGTQFSTYSPCCEAPEKPFSPSDDFERSTILLLDSTCSGLQACFTTNETLAKGFDKCIKSSAELELARRKKVGEVPANVTFYAPLGYCEYIDFATLKKGITGDAVGLGGLSVKKLVTICLGVMLISALL